MGFFLRWMFALLLLIATFNPTRWNYSRWAMNNYAEETPLAVLLGLLLFIGYVIYLRATLKSIGGIGVIAVLAVFAAALWVAYDWGWLTFTNSATNTWLGLVALSFVLGIGMSWSHFQRTLSGQVDVDDMDD